MTTRRGFLKFLSAAPAAAAVVPGALIGGEPAENAALRPGWGSSGSALVPPKPDAYRAWIRENGFHKKQIENIRRNAKSFPVSIDPDIAAFRSMSEATKRRLQVEREVQKHIDFTIGGWDFDDWREAIVKSLGFYPQG